MSILANLPHRVTAQIRTRTLDALGGSRDSYSTVFTDRPCWRQVANDKEILEFEKRGISITDKFYFTSDPELNERHRLLIGGETWEVRSFALPDASAGLGVVYRVMAEWVSTEGEIAEESSSESSSYSSLSTSSVSSSSSSSPSSSSWSSQS